MILISTRSMQVMFIGICSVLVMSTYATKYLLFGSGCIGAYALLLNPWPQVM